MYVYTTEQNVQTPDRSLPEPTQQFDKIPLRVYWRDEENVARFHYSAKIVAKAKFTPTQEENQKAAESGARITKLGKAGRAKIKPGKKIRPSFLTNHVLGKVHYPVRIESQKARETLMAYLYAAHLEGRLVTCKEVALVLGTKAENVARTISERYEENTWEEAMYIQKTRITMKVLNKSCLIESSNIQMTGHSVGYSLKSNGVRLMEAAYQDEKYKPLIKLCTHLSYLFSPIHEWGKDKTDRSPWPEDLYRLNMAQIQELTKALPELLDWK